MLKTHVVVKSHRVFLFISRVWGREGGNAGDREGKRPQRTCHTSEVCFCQEGGDGGGPGRLARQHDLLTADHQLKTWLTSQLLDSDFQFSVSKMSNTLACKRDNVIILLVFCFWRGGGCVQKNNKTEFGAKWKTGCSEVLEMGQYVSNPGEWVSPCSLCASCFEHIILC